MKNKRIISILIYSIIAASILAGSLGIFSSSGSGSYEYQSIRGETVRIYGLGLYKDMSTDVAIQGIAQDYVTLFIAIPLLIVGLIWFRKGSQKSVLFLSGVINYFLLTYLFYMNMAMYNEAFLLYIFLAGTSFFAFILCVLSIDLEKLPELFSNKIPYKFIGGFMMFTASAIALLWLSVIVPPLLDGTISPKSVEHYTTLTVQGFDLSIFHPILFVSGLLFAKKRKFGYLMASVSIVFLPLLMTALIAKIIAMAASGVNVIPAVFIIPAVAVTALISAVLVFKGIRKI